MALTPAAGGGGEPGSYRPLAEINVTPLVDVMLVLLIVFMVAAPLMMVGVPLQLPKTSAAKVGQPQKPVIVSIDRAGAIYLRNDPVAEERLGAALGALHAEVGDAVVYVRGDGALAYRRVMQLLGRIGEAGFTRVSLIAEAESAPPAR